MDYLLAIAYSISSGDFVYFVFVAPLFHTFAVFVSPHCYEGHCQNEHTLCEEKTVFECEGQTGMTEANILGTCLSSLHPVRNLPLETLN